MSSFKGKVAVVSCVVVFGLVLSALAYTIEKKVEQSPHQLSMADLQAVSGGGCIDIEVGAKCENDNPCEANVDLKLVFNEDWYAKISGTFQDGGDVDVKCGIWYEHDPITFGCEWSEDEWKVSATISIRF